MSQTHHCDLCGAPAPSTLTVDLKKPLPDTPNVSIVARVFFSFEGKSSGPPDLCDACLLSILQDLTKKYSAAG